MESNAIARPRVFTIGHSNHKIDHFLSLLKTNAVQVVVDIRSQPYSKHATQFDRNELKAALQVAGVRYLYLGRELGGRPQGDEHYDGAGRVVYERVAASRLFKVGLSRIERGIREFRVAMLCAEENPAQCHRRLLVGRVLRDREFEVQHIRGDARLQTEEELGFESDSNRHQLLLFHKVGQSAPASDDYTGLSNRH